MGAHYGYTENNAELQNLFTLSTVLPGLVLTLEVL